MVKPGSPLSASPNLINLILDPGALRDLAQLVPDVGTRCNVRLDRLRYARADVFAICKDHVCARRRFRALLDRFSGRTPVPPERAAFLAKDDPLTDAGPLVGARTWSEIEARIEALRTDAATPLISATEVDLIDALLAVRETAPFALEQLRDIAVDMPTIRVAIGLMQERLEALDARGVDVTSLAFDSSYGRTLMEYYDGFVFGFYAEARPDLPAIASGGRYDALTRHLGQGAEIPAVGGVMRPGLMLELEGLT